MESLCFPHLIYCLMKSLDYCWCKRLCHITDSKTDYLLIRICLLICCNLFTYCTKQVASR